jgi:hypothetical protein
MQFDKLRKGVRFKSRVSPNPGKLIPCEKIGDEPIEEVYYPRGLGVMVEVTHKGNARRLTDGHLIFLLPHDQVFPWSQKR